MKIKITFLFFLITVLSYGQKDSVIEKKLYKNGNIKLIAFNRGTDTVEIRKFFKNGQRADSLWLVISGKKEQGIGIEKSYYENGKPSSITIHGKEEEDAITLTYRENGMLSSHIVKPTGVSRYYNKKGEVIKQFDENKFDKDVYVSKKYKHQKHLKNTNYIARIKCKKAYLINEKNKTSLSSGSIFSMILNSDTTSIDHCQIEGFSNDTIYISKFEYNVLYDRVNDFEILKYDSTFALPINKIKTLIYAKHYNGKRAFGAQTAYVIGTELKLFPILFGILLAKDIVALAPYYGGSIALGFVLTEYSKYLYKTTVPKKYDLQKWKLKIKL